MTTLTLPAPSARTMVRRLYFYGVALVSFIAALIAFNLLLQTLAAVWLEGGWLEEVVVDFTYVRDTVAAGGGLLLVATPIFLLHWGFAQRRADEDERRSALRKLFLYGASLVAVGYALYYSYELLQGLALLALGEPALSTPIWPSKWLADLLMVIAGIALQAYFHAILVQDGDYGAEIGGAGTLRRLYQTLAGLVGLALVILGLGGIIETLVRLLLETSERVVGAGWWRMAVSGGVAQALVGALLVRINWMRWRTLAVRNPAEAQTALRRFYLYGSVVIGALATLIPAAALLNEALIQLFDVGGLVPEYQFWDAVATALAFSPVGLAVWWWHWRYLRGEADAYGESSQGATVRRLYYYAVAATGLILLWFGAGNIIQSLLDALLSQHAAGDRFWIYPLATGLSLLAVGAPIWAYHWRVVESIARREDRTGLEERASGPRKVYLYGVALVGALLILFYLARVVYRLLLVLLGKPAMVLMSSETADEIARSAIAAILWTVHVLAIRRDSRQGTETPPVAQAADLETRRAALAARIGQLEADLATARAELAALERAEPTAPQP